MKLYLDLKVSMLILSDKIKLRKMVITLSIQGKGKHIPRNSMTSACVILTKGVFIFIFQNTFHFSKFLDCSIFFLFY